MRGRRTVGVAVAIGGAVAVIGTGAPALAVTATPATGPDHEMPFLCGEQWTGTTRPRHSPSSNAVDWNAPGDLGHPVLASAPGVVTTVVRQRTSYGNYVVVDHGNGQASLYAHLLSTWLVPGTAVDQSTPLGFLGSTGNSTGPHLHFEERVGGGVAAPYFHRTRWVFGTTAASRNCPDRPATGDWNGDGAADLGIFRSTSSGGLFRQRVGGSTSSLTFGMGWDRTFTGDWNGDGRDEVGVRPPDNPKFVLRGRNGALTKISYGSTSALPVIGDWNGDRRDDVGTWRPDTRQFAMRRANGTSAYVTFGNAGDLPVSGDWNGDRVSDLGVYRPAYGQFWLRVVSRGTTSTRVVPVGQAGELPVTGDWNDDGITDLGTWRPSTARYTLQHLAAGGVASGDPVTRALGYRRG